MLVRFKPEIVIDKDKIFQRMKINVSSPTYKSISESFNNLLETVRDVVNFESTYIIKDRYNSFNIKEIDKCKKIAYCFTSIGKNIIDIINQYFTEDEYLEGYLLNLISDELVMSSSRQMRHDINNKVSKEGYHLTKRYSPGECGLDIKFQETVLYEIKKETSINAYLTESYMIVPEKSTLFLYGIDKNIPETAIDHDCSQCTKDNCPYRK